VVSLKSLPLYSRGKSPQYSLDRSVGNWMINEYVAAGEMRTGKRKWKKLEKTCPSVILFTTNSTSSDQGSDLVFSDGIRLEQILIVYIKLTDNWSKVI
jgi:hypothetical protein